MIDFNENYEEIYGKYDKIEIVQCGTDKHPACRKKTVRTEMNYNDKIVLDIGADYGSTAEYFLGKGAKSVIAVEKNLEYFEKLKIYSKGKPITPLLIDISTPKQILDLLVEFKPDIVKIDCEGCEFCLPQKFYSKEMIEQFRIPEFYVVEVHAFLGWAWRFTDGIYLAGSPLVNLQLFTDFFKLNSFKLESIVEYLPSSDIEKFEQNKLLLMVTRRKEI